MNIPYLVKVAVVEGPWLTGTRAPIIGYTGLYAEMLDTCDDAIRQVVHIKNNLRLHPGVYMGDMTPIVKKSDLPIGAEIVEVI